MDAVSGNSESLSITYASTGSCVSKVFFKIKSLPKTPLMLDILEALISSIFDSNLTSSSENSIRSASEGVTI